MNIYSAKDIRTIDSLYMQATGVPEQDLIERAAEAFVKAFPEAELTADRVLVLAGPGNNGADARAVARRLQETGWQVDLWEFPKTFERSGWQEIWKDFLVHWPKNAPVVDGLFGSGLTRPLQGDWASVVESINDIKAKVYAVDIPSGLPGDGAQEQQEVPEKYPVVRAAVTLSFQFPKLAFFLQECYPYVGDWQVLDIGMDIVPYPTVRLPFVTAEKEMIQTGLPGPRHPFSNKYDHGHALLLAGSRGKMGAALMAAKACMRMGAGALTVHIPRCGESSFYAALPEVMLSVDNRTDFAADNPERWKGYGPRHAAVGMGPGWGRNPMTADLMERLLVYLKEHAPQMPLILDADALYFLATQPRLWDVLPVGTVLTPHTVEFNRLAASLGFEKASSTRDRIYQAVRLAEKRNVLVVLKGRYTLITNGTEPHVFNTTGNPGMATAGSGDVLTGMVLGLLAQGIDPFKAAMAAVYLHGQAGDRAMAAYTATDLIDVL